MEIDFEKAFSDFLDRREYDEAESALFAMVRISFLAGWNAAGGEPPKPQKILELKTDFRGIDTNITDLWERFSIISKEVEIKVLAGRPVAEVTYEQIKKVIYDKTEI